MWNTFIFLRNFWEIFQSQIICFTSILFLSLPLNSFKIGLNYVLKAPSFLPPAHPKFPSLVCVEQNLYLHLESSLQTSSPNLANPSTPRTGWGKSRFTVVSMWHTEFFLVLLFINYCIIFHRNNCKPTFAPPCILILLYFHRPVLCHPISYLLTSVQLTIVQFFCSNAD